MSEKWQPIETAPKNGTKVDLWYPGIIGRVADSFWAEDGVWSPGYWITRDSEGDTHLYPNSAPTHWMPLPTSPSNEEGGQDGA